MGRRVARSLPAALAGGIGFWLALGTVAPDGHGARLGVLAPWWVLVLLVTVPLAAAAISDAGAGRSRAWLLGALGILPWLPIAGLPALLLWQGPLAIALLGTAVAVTFWPFRRGPRTDRPGRTSPARHTTVAVLVALVAYFAAAWRMAPILPGGDEPHYLIITQSLLHDRDLAIENNHRQREYLAYIDQPIKPDYLRRGVDGAIYSIHAPGVSVLIAPGFAAAGYPGAVLLLALAAALGAGFVWRAAWRITGDPESAWIGWASVALSVPFFFHAFTLYPDGPGAVLVMLAVYGLIRGRSTDATPPHQRAITWLAAIAIAMLPWLHTRFSILAAALGSIWLLRLWQESGARVHSRVHNPGEAESPERPVHAGPKSPRFQRRGSGGTEVPPCDRNVGPARVNVGVGTARLLAFAAIPVASALLWFGFFDTIYGTPNPAAPYGGYTQSQLSNAWRGLSGLLIDQQFGLLANAPIYLAAVAGVWSLRRTHTRLLVELAVVTMPYTVAAASYHMWWGGRSAPARFLVPVLLPAGMAIAAAWQQGTRVGRVAIGALLTVSLAITTVLAGVGRGALVYNTRDGYALLLEWLAPLVRLPLAAPSLFRSGGPLADAWMQALLWALAACIGWAVLRRTRTIRDGVRNGEAGPPPSPRASADGGSFSEGRPPGIMPAARRPPLTVGVAAAAVALAVTIGAGLGWAVDRADAVDEGRALWRIARAAGRPGATGLRLPEGRFSDAGTMLAGVPIPSEARRESRQGPLFAGRDLPPGQYAVREAVHVVGDRSIGATVGRGLPPIATADLSQRSGARPLMLLNLPFGASMLTIDRAAGGPSRSGALTLAPVRLFRVPRPLARAAIPAARGTLWILDDHAWAEPGGFWTRGTQATTVGVDVDGPVPLRVRNGAAANEVLITSGAWRVQFPLSPGEAREVDVPASARLAPITIGAARAFRPVDHDPASSDARLLGVWVEMR